MSSPFALLAQAEASTAAGWFDGIDPDKRFVLTIIALGCLTAVVISLGSVVAGVWGSANRRRLEDDMKRDLLDRGLSAEEVAKIIEAAAPPEDGLGRWLANCGKKR